MRNKNESIRRRDFIKKASTMAGLAAAFGLVENAKGSSGFGIKDSDHNGRKEECECDAQKCEINCQLNCIATCGNCYACEPGTELGTPYGGGFEQFYPANVADLRAVALAQDTRTTSQGGKLVVI